VSRVPWSRKRSEAVAPGRQARRVVLSLPRRLAASSVTYESQEAQPLAVIIADRQPDEIEMEERVP
jgi:hypothetical protein